MKAVCLAAELEWSALLKYYNVEENSCSGYPYGRYFLMKEKDTGFFLTGKRKSNAAGACQYIIDHFGPDRVILIGSCAGIDPAYNVMDIVVPDLAVQTDTTVWELDRLIREEFTSRLSREGLESGFKTGTAASSDKAVVMWEDCIRLRENGITIADTESAAFAYVCRLNGLDCTVIRGISDFPHEFTPEEAADTGNAQIQGYLRNTPVIIERILRECLEKIY